mmetsp:Transcript_18951/g.44890  ORF Transcript_18951/g.44890 Transcript_18951/m.44890 type:complete len:87 (-) Transcript_18951:520-780(-)
MNTALALQAHTNATVIQIISTQITPTNVYCNADIRIAANKSGKTQYPNTHTDWKNDNRLPSNWALTVTTAAPTHTATKTAPNTALA